jgi:hypothetical protein
VNSCDLSFGPAAKPIGIPADPKWLRALLPRRVIGGYMLFRHGEAFYVGRSDYCLQTRLAEHALLGDATHVCWHTCGSPQQAFRFESYWYDALKPTGSLWNLIHPAKPHGDPRSCPFCDLRGPAIRAALPFAGQGLQ